MRIALTALTPRGPQDLVVSADDGAVVGQVAAALREAARASANALAPVVALPRTQTRLPRATTAGLRRPQLPTSGHRQRQAPPAIAAP